MKDYQYFGLQICKNDRESLIDTLSNIFNVNDNVLILDHVTLMHVSQHDDDLYKFLNSKLGRKVQIVIDRIGQSDQAVVFGVYLCSYRNMCKNKNPHITIMVRNSGKPVDSNYITDWEDIDPIIIKTVVVKK